MLFRSHLLLTLVFFGFSQAQGRVWTDIRGGQFEGELLKKSSDSVWLNVGGRQRKLAISELSEKDRSYLQGGNAPAVFTNSQKAKARKRPAKGEVHIQADTGLKVVRLRAEPEKKRWSYGSPNFEFICNEDLGYATVREFAWMFESVWQFCARQPYDLPRLRAQQKVRMKTYLVSSQRDYVRMGGPPGSAGVYKPALDIIIIPFKSLGIVASQGRYRVDKKDNNHTLRHEVTHQIMQGQSQQAGWFIEGSAEFAATVPYRNTRMLLTHHPRAIVDFVTAYGANGREGYNLGRALKLPSLETFMIPDYRAFQRHRNAYPYSLLLYTFFIKLDGDKKGTRLANYVAALQDGRPENLARKHLLAGRSYQELERDMSAAWNQFGIRLSFE